MNIPKNLKQIRKRCAKRYQSSLYCSGGKHGKCGTKLELNVCQFYNFCSRYNIHPLNDNYPLDQEKEIIIKRAKILNKLGIL